VPSKEEIPQNSQKAREKAQQLFPEEIWDKLEKGIFIAKSRMPKSKNQKQTLEKELIQARILAEHGSTIYLLPESSHEDGKKHPDAIVDEYVMEFKTITGSIRQIEERFKESRLKADSVFFKIDSNLKKDDIINKLKWIIMQKSYCGGKVIVYITENGKLYFWDINDFLM